MSQEVGKSLQALALAMREEQIALKTYQGDSWEVDGYEYITNTLQARESFEKNLNQFVEVLVNA